MNKKRQPTALSSTKRKEKMDNGYTEPYYIRRRHNYST